uniref:Putative secreted protein n=1 Tax=Anopheles darlingi TaxID=43151 RepID=A0A2M4DF26_ANODA
MRGLAAACVCVYVSLPASSNAPFVRIHNHTRRCTNLVDVLRRGVYDPITSWPTPNERPIVVQWMDASYYREAADTAQCSLCQCVQSSTMVCCVNKTRR